MPTDSRACCGSCGKQTFHQKQDSKHDIKGGIEKRPDEDAGPHFRKSPEEILEGTNPSTGLNLKLPPDTLKLTVPAPDEGHGRE